MLHDAVNLRIYSGLRIASLIVAACGPTFTAASAENTKTRSTVTLKLDYDLVPRIDSPSADSRSLVDGALPEDLPSRVLKVQDQVQALEQSNADKARLLAERQRLLAGIQGIVRAQERMIEVLETEAAASADNPVAPAEPTPPAVVAKPTISLRRIGPLEIPASIRPWLVEGSLGMIIVVLLGIVFHLRASAAAKDAELKELSAGLIHTDAAAKTTPSAAVREAASSVGAVDAASGAVPAMIPAQTAEAGWRDPGDLNAESIAPETLAPQPDPVPNDTGSDKPASVSASPPPKAAPDTEPMADDKADDMDFLFDVFADDEDLAKKFHEDS